MRIKRICMACLGVIITGFSVGIFQKAALGTDPFTCFATGAANLFHSTYSTLFLILTALILCVVFFLDRHRIGIATLLNLFGTGAAADGMKAVLDQAVPSPGTGLRVILLCVALVAMCFSASLYFTADLGVSAYDAVSLILSARHPRTPFRLFRIATDLLCVSAGLVFSADVGIGTVLTAFCMGPLIQFFNTYISEPFLHRKER